MLSWQTDSETNVPKSNAINGDIFVAANVTVN